MKIWFCPNILPICPRISWSEHYLDQAWLHESDTSMGLKTILCCFDAPGTALFVSVSFDPRHTHLLYLLIFTHILTCLWNIMRPIYCKYLTSRIKGNYATYLCRSIISGLLAEESVLRKINCKCLWRKELTRQFFRNTFKTTKTDLSATFLSFRVWAFLLFLSVLYCIQAYCPPTPPLFLCNKNGGLVYL